MSELIAAIILGFVEGLTEFLPVSSTGHLILVGYLLDFEGPRAVTFTIFIQLGAILAVVLLYRRRFTRLLSFRWDEGFAGLRGLTLLGLTTLPILLLGALGSDFITERLFNPTTVAVGLGLGGLGILLVEHFWKHEGQAGLDALTWRDALAIGLFQCLALWPGVSRATTTILGGRLVGVERQTATEYSFFAAVPVIFAATIYDMLTSFDALQASDFPLFATGFAVAFFSALFAVKFFIRLVGSHTLIPFGWYRLVVTVIVVIVLQ